MRHGYYLALTGSVCFLLAVSAQAQRQWIGGDGGEFFDAGNWSGLTSPDPSDDLEIAGASRVSFDDDIKVNGGSLHLLSGAGLSVAAGRYESVQVGMNDASGTIQVLGGSILRTHSTVVGYRGHDGTIRVSGAGSRWEGGSGMVLGGRYGASTGTCVIEDGAAGQWAGLVTLGEDDVATGILTLSGSTSRLETGDAYVGSYGTGEIRIGQGATWIGEGITLGRWIRSSGSLWITERSKVTGNFLTVGGSGAGTFRLDGGSQLDTRGSVNSYVGHNEFANGKAIVADPDTLWRSDRITVGSRGAGRLEILNGAVVESDSGGVGTNLGRGELLLSGPQSRWSLSGGFYVTSIGSGDSTVTVQNGARLEMGSMEIGQNRSAVQADVTVTGAGSAIVTTDALWMGTTDDANPNRRLGRLTIGEGALVDVGGRLWMYPTATIVLDGGTLRAAWIEPEAGGDSRPAATIQFNRGRLETSVFRGSLDVGGGTLAPGLSIGDLSLHEQLNLGPRSVVEIEMDASGFDTVSARDVILGGTLAVKFLDEWRPADGDEFQFFSWNADSGSLTGRFDAYDLPALRGLAWDTDRLATEGVLAVTVPEPATLAALLAGPLLLRRRRR